MEPHREQQLSIIVHLVTIPNTIPLPHRAKPALKAAGFILAVSFTFLSFPVSLLSLARSF